METERRKQPRIEVSWPVTVIADWGSVQGEIKNINVEGVMILCEEPLRDHKAIGVTGKVVWSDAYCMDENDGVFGIGLCLVEISDQDRKALSDILADYQ
jgi:hypothetical protein